MAPKPKVYVTIMAGGGGTRFWPWSREERPKQILPIISGQSMIRETVNRIRPLVPPEKIFIVTSSSQLGQIRRQVPQIPAGNLLAEPEGKNTAPCLCLAAWHIQKLSPDAIMVALPADHHISDHKGFRRTLKIAVEFASRQNFLITLGLRPTAPETGYGYIQQGEIIGRVKNTPVFKVKAFREKPTRQKARAFLRQGDYLWNSGMFVWKVSAFLKAVKKCLPVLYEDTLILKKAVGTSRERSALKKAYACCQSISVDYGVMEKAANVAMIEAQFPWDDVGSWSALWSIRPKDQNGNACVGSKPDGRGKILTIDSSGCLIRAEKKLVAVLGMKDTIVVEAGDAFLVCPRQRSQEVRQILKELKNKGWKEYL